MRRSPYIPGPTLAGFYGLFDADWGDPSTPKPYARITPSAMGRVLLPFRCPRCRRVCDEFSDPEARAKYHDRKRGHSFCPGCGLRFYLDEKGAALKTGIPAGAVVAPSVVTEGGKARVQDKPSLFAGLFGARRHSEGTAILGALQ